MRQKVITNHSLKINMENISKKIQELEKKITGNMLEDMDIRDKIHNLKMQLDGTKPSNSEIDCVGCGS